MASITVKSPRPVLAYVERIDAQAGKQKDAEFALVTKKQREAEDRADSIRNTSELASQLRRIPIQDNKTNEEIGAPSSSFPYPSSEDVTELDGRALPIIGPQQASLDSSGLQPSPTHSLFTLSSDATTSRIDELETRLTKQNARIHELELSCGEFTNTLKDLQAKRDEAEKELLEATIAGTAAREEKKQQEDIVTALKKQIRELMEERRSAEGEIEKLRVENSRLRKELAEEKDKVTSLETISQVLERSERIATASTTGGSAIGTSARRSSTGESERRRRGHGRSHSNGSNHYEFNFFKYSDGKEKKIDKEKKRELEKKKKDSRK